MTSKEGKDLPPLAAIHRSQDVSWGNHATQDTVEEILQWIL